MARKNPPPPRPTTGKAEVADLIAEELSDLEQDTLETRPASLPEEANATPVDFSAGADDSSMYEVGSETRVIMTPGMQMVMEAGVSAATGRMEPLPEALHATLEIEAGAVFRLTKSLTIIGRVKEVADLVIEHDEEVSRHHAAISYRGGEFFLEDLESTNGTYVENKRVKRIKIEHGASIRIGHARIRFRLKKPG
jgi:hypothetical protein